MPGLIEEGDIYRYMWGNQHHLQVFKIQWGSGGPGINTQLAYFSLRLIYSYRCVGYSTADNCHTIVINKGKNPVRKANFLWDLGYSIFLFKSESY